MLHTPPEFIVCGLLNDGHSNQYEMIPHCSFDLIFLIISNVKHLFCAFWAICMSFLGKCLFISSAYFFIGLCALMILSCINCKFWRLISCQSHYLQIFSPTMWIVFLFYGFLHCVEALEFS